MPAVRRRRAPTVAGFGDTAPVGFDAARALAETLLAHQLPELWERAQRAAIRARELGEHPDLDRDLLMTAAVLHPIGHSPVARRTGDPIADGARFLSVRGFDPRIVALVAGQTGDAADPASIALRDSVRSAVAG